MTDNQEIETNRVAASIIQREIGTMHMAWLKIKSIDDNWPDAPVGISWDTLKHINRQINAMIKEWERDN